MLQKFEIRAVHAEVDDNLRKYVTKKIGSLDKYISRHDRESAHGEVQLKESKSKDRNTCQCEVTIYLPHGTIVVTEKALNMFAAVDIAEVKLKQQLQKHKEVHGTKGHRHLLARLRNRPETPLLEAETDLA